MKILVNIFLILIIALSVPVPVGETEPAKNIVVSLDEIEMENKTISRDMPVYEWKTYKVTGYCLCEECCGKTDGIGASGEQVKHGISIATSSEYDFGTILFIDGIGERTVQDRGSAIKDGCIDVLFKDHKTATDFGVQYLKVRVMEDASH